jgi:glycosyltransferase involved in cell wall biosynthesis
MKFGIITHAEHKLKEDGVFAYEPYIREMNLWAKHVEEITILAPLSKDQIVSKIDSKYNHSSLEFVTIKNFDITSFKNAIVSLILIPKICFQIYKVMISVDHIHLRCPGNIGLLACLVQILFPKKTKTVKYAGNWDPKSKQPLSYKIQKWILSNVYLTKNCKVLVYGKWSNQSKNIIPFFTASYSKDEIIEFKSECLINKIKLLFVGNFSPGKQPLLTVRIAEKLILKGHDIQLDMYGYGVEYDKVKQYISKNGLSERVILHGNQPKDIVKKAFQESCFLVFISKSEGWPKVVAEAMFWSCLPISSSISCIPFMLGNGERGSIVNPNVNEIVIELEKYLNDKNRYLEKIINAKEWSQEFTLEKFENEIKKTL